MTPLRGGRGLPAWEEVYGSDAIRSDTAVQSTECKNITWEDPNSHKNTSSWKADLELLQKIVQREHLLSEMMDIFGKGKRNPASSTASLPSPIDSVSIVVLGSLQAESCHQRVDVRVLVQKSAVHVLHMRASVGMQQVSACEFDAL